MTHAQDSLMVWGSTPHQGRNFCWDLCTTYAPWPIPLWWVHWLYTVSGKTRRCGRGLDARPHMPRPRNWSC